MRLCREPALQVMTAREMPVAYLGLSWRDPRAIVRGRDDPHDTCRGASARVGGVAGDGPARPSVSSLLAVRRVRGPGGRSGPARTPRRVIFRIRRHSPIGTLCRTIPGMVPGRGEGGAAPRAGQPPRPLPTVQTVDQWLTFPKLCESGVETTCHPSGVSRRGREAGCDLAFGVVANLRYRARGAPRPLSSALPCRLNLRGWAGCGFAANLRYRGRGAARPLSRS